MGQLSRVWAAATVAAVRAQRERAVAGAGARERVAGLAPQAAALVVARAAAGDGRRQAGAADESLRRAMYLSCWGPS